MDWQRNLFIAAIIVVVALLFMRWNEFQEQQREQARAGVDETVVVPEIDDRQGMPATDNAIPEAVQRQTDNDRSQPAATETRPDSRLVTVTTDVLEITIDTYGGDIVHVALLEHLESLEKEADPLVLLTRTSNRTYVAQSGLVGSDGTDTSDGRARFRVDRENYQLGPGEDSLTVDLHYNQDGVTITKQFEFRRGDYLVDMRYIVDNQGSDPWQAGLFGQIKRDSHEPPAGDGLGMKPYVGPAITTPEDNYHKVEFSELREKPFKTQKTGGWVAMLQHYYLSAWVPDQEQLNQFNLRQLGDQDIYALGFISPSITVAPGERGITGAGFYVGPKDQYRLREIAPYLDLTVDYGWLWWIAKPLFAVMNFIHGLVGNWGWSIILLTVLIKLAFFKLSATSYRSMAKMRKLQPEMQRLKELYGDDRQKLSQEMMNFYKKEKVNPLGGCLPILVQMPVFIALYWVLFESVELRHAPWILWIQDLSVKDPYFVLPVLNGISMYVTTLLQPEPPDPTQAKIMKIMPVAFSFMFAFFPAGLVLYWTVNSLLSIAQQWYITRQVEQGGDRR